MTETPGVDLDALTAWAESDDPAHAPGTTRHGGEAARAGKAELALAGRPTLGHRHATGNGRSPRRQVRLPADLNDRLDRLAGKAGKTSSMLIRDAVEDYLDRLGA